LERLLVRDRAIVLASLIGLSLLAWLYLVALALEMARGDMTLMGMEAMAPIEAMAKGGAMVMAAHPWSVMTFALMLAMWWVMMIGMMVPSAAPTILLFARLQRGKSLESRPAMRSALFTLGYLILWLAFSIAATVAQWVLSEAALLSPMMASASPVLGAVILAATGIYQLTPLKRACLDHCQSPIGFLSTHWRKGDLGALRMGLAHGVYCVGCCWFLMALLFVGGVMNLVWTAAIAVFVLLEKVLPRDARIAETSGLVLLSCAPLLLFMG